MSSSGFSRDRALLSPEAERDVVYKAFLPYLIGDHDANPPEWRDLIIKYRNGSVDTALENANWTLDAYLNRKNIGQSGAPQFREKTDKHLRLWHQAIDPRIQDKSTLDDAQKIKLIEQIYTMLFIAGYPGCSQNEISRLSDDDKKIIRPSNIQRVEQLNNEVFNWSAWKVAASLCRMFLGAFMATSAGCAIASGFGVVLGPVWALMASVSGEATIVAGLYIANELRIQFNRDRQYNDMAAAYKKTKNETTSYATGNLLLGYVVGTPVVGAATGTIIGSLLYKWGIQSAALSLSKDVSLKATLDKTVSVASVNKVGAIGGALGIVGLTGIHAFFKGCAGLKKELYDKKCKSAEIREASTNFVTLANGGEVKEDKQHSSSSFSSIRPPVVGR